MKSRYNVYGPDGSEHDFWHLKLKDAQSGEPMLCGLPAGNCAYVIPLSPQTTHLCPSCAKVAIAQMEDRVAYYEAALKRKVGDIRSWIASLESDEAYLDEVLNHHTRLDKNGGIAGDVGEGAWEVEDDGLT